MRGEGQVFENMEHVWDLALSTSPFGYNLCSFCSNKTAFVSIVLSANSVNHSSELLNLRV